MRFFHTLAALTLLVAVSFPEIALAQDGLATARSAYEEADFPTAIQALEEAEHAEQLSREQLEEIYFLRAMVYSAEGQDDNLTDSLRRLLAISPDYQPDSRTTPPVVAEAFARVQGRIRAELSIRVQETVEPGRAELVVELNNDELQLVSQVRIHYMSDADASWQTEFERATIELADGGMVSYYADAIGPGGVILATTGSEDSPQSVELPSPAPPEQAIDEETAPFLPDREEYEYEDEEEDEGGFPWGWVVVATLLVVGGGVLAFLLLSDGDDNGGMMGNVPTPMWELP